MRQSRVMDPPFAITCPTADQIVGPSFSVYGTCANGTTGIVAYVGTGQAAIVNGTSWEATFSGVSAADYYAFATYSGNGRYPANGGIHVQVEALVTINPPTSGGLFKEGGNGDPPKPWDGWYVDGTYDIVKIKSVSIFVTHNANPVSDNTGNTITHPCDCKGGNWICKLDFMPPEHVGNNFCIHYEAVTNKGKIVRGSRGFFVGPGGP